MKTLLLKNVSLASVQKRAFFLTVNTNGKIGQFMSENESLPDDAQIIDLQKAEIYAGFIDIHNHGAVGVDVNTATADDLRKASKFLASKGITAWLPTFVPDSTENYQKAINAIDEVMQTQDEEKPAARILGVHYEGVFANEKMCGALRPQYFKTFKTGKELDEIPKLKTSGAIHLTTLAPEIDGGIELIKELVRQNWIVSIGHTRADVETLNKAFEAGAKQITHLFNAMTGLHHREIGAAGWALGNEKVRCEIIADGIHVNPEILKLAYKIKTAEKLMLISDSVSPTGLGDGNYNLWGEKISVINGRTQNERGSIAGSVITMLDAVKMMLSLGISESEVSRMASLTVAEALGFEKDYGSIEIGKRADLVVMDESGNIKMTIIGGRIVQG